MSLSRTLRKTICRMLLGVMLFANFAVASYACPGLSSMGSMSSATAVTAAAVTALGEKASLATSAETAPGWGQIDPEAANLCAEHCRFGQQSADTAPAPGVPAALPTLLYLLPLEPEQTFGSGRSFPALDASLAAAPPPPHAILHCVFRI